MTGARADMGATQAGSRIALMGGRVSLLGQLTNALEFLDPASGTWTAGTPLPEAMHATSVVASDEAIYVTDPQLTDDYGSGLVLRDDVASQTWAYLHAIAGIGGTIELAIVGNTLYAMTSSGLWSYSPLP